MTKHGYVYILTNKTNNVFYIGVTNDIVRRIYEHKCHLVQGFTYKYNVTKLIYVEEYNLMTDAIAREKQLKKWRREKKIDLIKTVNPDLTEITL
ncbi:MAG: GIY-YIG nuclease family protein [Clostridia bacterium]|nr:GIY-YIG nuclease family protein [Clostridia bacterium]